MFYHLLYRLHDVIPWFRVFRYITFRTASATITALLISFVLGPLIIRKLRAFNLGQKIRHEGPQSHQVKAGTPTMGGILILIAMLGPSLLWGDLTNRYMQVALVTTLVLGLTGLLDDYLHVVRGRKSGLQGRYKLAAQYGIGLLVGYILFASPWSPYPPDVATTTNLPFIKWQKGVIDLGIFYIIFASTVIAGTSNAVNLADGLDGLAAGLVAFAGMALGAMSYLSGNLKFAGYLNIPYLPGAGELTIFAGTLVGASLGFLWYNCAKAEVFMGDVGSLALGGALGVMAVLIKREMLLAIVGGVFVAEALSVMIQVGFFKMTGRRVFRMAPLHHHFEEGGWPETKVVVRFWIVGALLALVSLSTFKLQ